mgnify:FL=1
MHAYRMLDASEFCHERINHADASVKGGAISTALSTSGIRRNATYVDTIEYYKKTFISSSPNVSSASITACLGKACKSLLMG